MDILSGIKPKIIIASLFIVSTLSVGIYSQVNKEAEPSIQSQAVTEDTPKVEVVEEAEVVPVETTPAQAVEAPAITEPVISEPVKEEAPAEAMHSGCKESEVRELVMTSMSEENWNKLVTQKVMPWGDFANNMTIYRHSDGREFCFTSF